MTKIFIVGHFSPNLGNSAVLCSMLEAFKKVIPDVHISVSTYDPKVVAQAYAQTYDVDPVEYLIKIRDAREEKRLPIKLALILIELLWVLKSFIWVTFNKHGINIPIHNAEKKETIQRYLNADVIVSPGGHIFTSLNKFPGQLINFHSILIAKMLNKPVVLYAQSIGPFLGMFGRLSKSLMKIVNHVDLITVRDDASRKALKDLGITKPQIYLTADSVFLMPPPEEKRIDEIISQEVISKEKNRPLIGFTIHHIYYSQYFKREEYKKIMAQVADYLVNKFNANVIFIPMEMKYTHGGDRPLANEIVKLMRYRENAIVIEKEYDAQETMGIIGRMDAFVGTKTHSVVFALRMKVPIICIAYHIKSREFMKQFDQERFVIDMDKLTFNKFKDKMSVLWSNRDSIKKDITIKLKSIQNSSLLNAKLVSDLITSGKKRQGGSNRE